MASLLEILEADLVAQPDEIATHMAYADLLNEAGDPRGEFIQLQLSLEQLPPRSGKRLALRRRVFALINEHAHDWLGELAPYMLGRPHSRATPFTFARGWLDEIHLEGLNVELALVLARAPQLRLLRKLRIDEIDREAPGDYPREVDVPADLARPGLAVLFASPILGNLRRLELITSPFSLSARDLAPIVNSPYLQRLTQLRLRTPVFGPDHCQVLLESPLFPRLRELDLSWSYLLDNVAHLLAEADLKHLTRLNIDGNNLSQEGIEALRTTGAPLEIGSQNDPEEIPF